jgi:TonB-linked SusC/RagA family outer membrane protein
MNKFRWLLAVLLGVAMIPGGAIAQERGSITGILTDQSTGQPLVNAQVVVVGTRLGTLSNQQGRFLITGVEAGTYTIEASLLGYKQIRREVTVGAGPVVANLELEVDILRLDELVVVGYGVEKRRNVTGAVGSLKPEAVQELPSPAVEQVLQGRISGVQVSQNSGVPGSAISVRVRGSSSISAGNQPLYVIDGVPMTQGSFSGLDGTMGGQSIDALADLNPNEIESIEVLKDASAAAIYGSRASNGVVLVTTKRGAAKERADIQFNAYYGTQRDWKRVEFLNTDQYIEINNESLRNAGIHPNWFGYRGTTPESGVDYVDEIEPGVYTNWLDQVLRSAPISSMTGSIAGGTDRVRYYVSGSHFNQDGIVEGYGYERLNGRVNLDYSATDRLSLGTNVALARSVTLRSRGDNTIFGPFANAIANPPFQTVYDADGSYTDTDYSNPVGLAKENKAEERGVRILGNAFARYSLLPWLGARVSVGLDQLALRSRLYDSPVVGIGAGSNGSAEAADAFANKVTYEGTVDWLRDLDERHSISGVVGMSYEENSTERTRVIGQQFPTPYFRYLTSAAEITGGSSSLTSWSLMSYFTRLSYTLDDRYTLTFNVRTDGSSRFGKDTRYGIFPSGSFLWRVGDEAFLQDQNVIRNLALRVSYGRTGNQFGIGDFAALGLIQGGQNYGGKPGFAPTQLPNPDLKWETTDQFNIGTDFSVLSDRLSLNIDYYNKKTNDLLIARPIPSTSGFTTHTSNVGAMENRGFELAANAQVLQGGQDGLSWTVSANVAKNKNEVTALYNNEPIPAGFASRAMVGQPLGVFYGYKTDGIFRDQAAVDAHATQSGAAPGDIRFKDVNGRDADGKLTGKPDGQINDDDRTVIGSPWPDYVGGVTNTFSFRGIDLSAFVQFSQGNQIYNANRIYQDAWGTFDNNTTRALDRWTPENPDATQPRAHYYDPNNNARDSDRFVEDGSYLRLKNVVLGYTLPRTAAGRLGFQKLRLYVQGQNLLTATKYSGFDPEVNYGGEASITRGTDFYTLPQARSVTFGVNIGF